MTEQQWHNDHYKDAGNTCGQDTFYYCSELYNPKKSFSNSYTDYADCVTNKTPKDCGHEFTGSGPNQFGGGQNPYHDALIADSKHLSEMINDLEDYDPEIGYDSEELLEEWHEEHPNYEYGDDESIVDNIVNVIEEPTEDKNLMYVGIGAIAVIAIIALA